MTARPAGSRVFERASFSSLMSRSCASSAICLAMRSGSSATTRPDSSLRPGVECGPRRQYALDAGPKFLAEGQGWRISIIAWFVTRFAVA
jgi:hypothetical protein